jgi:hypothetical protein
MLYLFRTFYCYFRVSLSIRAVIAFILSYRIIYSTLLMTFPCCLSEYFSPVATFQQLHWEFSITSYRKRFVTRSAILKLLRSPGIDYAIPLYLEM